MICDVRADSWNEDEGCYSVEASRIMLFMGGEDSSVDYYSSVSEDFIIFIENNE